MELATIEDLSKIWRPLRVNELERAIALIEIVSDTLREKAYRLGKDLDKMSEERTSYHNLLKSVIVDVVARTLMTSTDAEPMIQTNESALGYSVSGTFLVPGGGVFIKDSELEKLGLKNQRYGVIDFYE